MRALPAPQRVEPGFSEAAERAGRCRGRPERAACAAARRQARLDALVDAIVPLALDAPVSGEAVLAHWPATRRAGTKPFYIEGPEHRQRRLGAAGRRPALQRTAGRRAAGQPQRRAQRDRVLRVRAQAAGLCRRRGRDARLPRHAGRGGPRPRARRLCRPAGRAAGGAAGGALGGLVGGLRAAVRRPPGPGAGRGGRAGWCCPAADEGAPPVLVLEFDAQAALADDPQAAALREVILSLDVPQTPAAVEPFPTWHKVAHALAEDMDADLLDDAGRPITLHAFDAIGKDLAQLYAALETHDLAAGSPAARAALRRMTVRRDRRAVAPAPVPPTCRRWPRSTRTARANSAPGLQRRTGGRLAALCPGCARLCRLRADGHHLAGRGRRRAAGLLRHRRARRGAFAVRARFGHAPRLGSALLAHALADARLQGQTRFAAWATPFSLPVFGRAGFALAHTLREPFQGVMFERYRVAIGPLSRRRVRVRASARTLRPRSGARRSCGRTAPWWRRRVSATARLCTISGASAPSMCTASTWSVWRHRPAASCSSVRRRR